MSRNPNNHVISASWCWVAILSSNKNAKIPKSTKRILQRKNTELDVYGVFVSIEEI